MQQRRGTILILIAGICAVMALLATTFLSAMRGEAEHNHRLLLETQNRVLLTGVCLFLLESAPKWGGDPAGPSGAIAAAVKGPHPLERWTRPPYAVGLDRIHAPFFTLVDRQRDHEQSYDYRPQAKWYDRRLTKPGGTWRPTFPRKDPTAYLLDPADPAMAAGDPTRIGDSIGRAWFRCHHEGNGVFLVTLGSGGTRGYKDWGEASASGLFRDRAHFEELLERELRSWYRITWAAYTAADLARLPEHAGYTGRVPIDWNAYEHPHEATAAWGITGHQTFSRPGDAWRIFGRIAAIERIEAAQLPGTW